MADEPNSPGTPASGSVWRNNVTFIIAIVILLLFSFFIIYMLQRTSDEETEWTRSVYIFGAVEAIAFAATGWIFGREVNRQRASEAENRAEKAEEDRVEAAKEAEKKTAKSEALRTAINVKNDTRRQTSSSEAGFQFYNNPQVGASVAASDLQELAEQANRLFPTNE